ncbi:uncharacterized protein PHACADRAFT_257501 [Phanerochaete carnosa HHB-10118-sp]|uniref:Survival protein SurE-like phosphatase/nucleotidase domain-containing protein n=1 Tax=Phanerochaete carnosa (strain HHB-10118-sp) TaxID=650164 RepID=K5UVD1_PHACS|nr:uncharacterized protein PHACADRAFT_257501 [Phanerochaete carnosa HHB-10118-sp]EKM53971.1 hypothetical protein PHACADRAFT_257501 [Phanerochaete carnosa HHB-10118-sp]
MLSSFSRLCALFFVGINVASVALGFNILLTNDDSWASANIRATYSALKAAGHTVLLVVPAVQNSGQGGRFITPTTNITAPGGEFGSIPVGASYFGHDVNDDHLWYFNGTPGASAVWGLDVIRPMILGNDSAIDLVVAGPNEGGNAGPFLFTLSGTMGATYTSVYRGIPAIAFSAGNSTHRSFTTLTNDTSDPANIAARLTTNFVNALANVTQPGQRALPLSVGIGINLPEFGPNSNCTDPPFILTRLAGGALVPTLAIGPDGFPLETEIVTSGVNPNFTGVPILPGETIISSGCQSSVSVFSIDYDAPTEIAQPLQLSLMPLFGKSSL